jgi:peptidyl-prolyl cis-trans isomerase SurA
MKRIRSQVLDSLIDEMVQNQEAHKLKVQVGNDEVDKSIARVAQGNGMQVEQIFKVIEGGGVTRKTWQDQIRSDIAWQKLIQGRFGARVVVSPEEIKAVLERTRATASKMQYLVSEIFLAVDSPEQEPTARRNAENVVSQIKQGAPFPALARQFSQSSSAAAGGDMGWIVEGQMGDEVDAKLKTMSPASISDPIRAAGGFYIIALRQKQKPADPNAKPEAEAPEAPPPQHAAARPSGPPKVKVIKGPSAQIHLSRLLIPLTAGASKAKQEAVREKAIALYRGVNGCKNLSAIAQSQGAQAVSIGAVNFKDLQPEFRKIIEQTPNGRATPPLRSNQGIEMFVICSGGAVVQVENQGSPMAGPGPAPAVKAFKMPTEKEIENRLFSQQLAMHARRYLRDLRRDATIDIREQ